MGSLTVWVSYEYYHSRFVSYKIELIVLYMLFCGKTSGYCMQVHIWIFYSLSEAYTQGDRQFASKVVKAWTTFPVCKNAGEEQARDF